MRTAVAVHRVAISITLRQNTRVLIQKAVCSSTGMKMMIEPFIIKNFEGKSIFLDKFFWDECGFQIVYLDDSPPKAKLQATISFEADVLSIRVTHAAQSWKVEKNIVELQAYFPSAQIPFPCMFTMTESEYIDWYCNTETIDNIYRLPTLKHFFFFVDDTLIEVIDDRIPKVTVSVI